jgi:hypothetical protein
MTTTAPRSEALTINTAALDTAILAPVFGVTSVREVVENWHRGEHTGRLDDCQAQPCKDFARTTKHPTPTHVIEEWHREEHDGGWLQHCNQQPCHAVARFARLDAE